MSLSRIVAYGAVFLLPGCCVFVVVAERGFERGEPIGADSLPQVFFVVAKTAEGKYAMILLNEISSTFKEGRASERKLRQQPPRQRKGPWLWYNALLLFDDERASCQFLLSPHEFKQAEERLNAAYGRLYLTIDTESDPAENVVIVKLLVGEDRPLGFKYAVDATSGTVRPISFHWRGEVYLLRALGRALVVFLGSFLVYTAAIITRIAIGRRIKRT